MDEERAIVGEAYLTTIFVPSFENPQMTATQVVELINQKGIFLAPMAGSMAPDYLGAVIEREMDIAKDLNMAMGGRLLPPMPGILMEAMKSGEHKTKIEYTSPLFKGIRAGDAAGFLRTVESVLEVAVNVRSVSLRSVQLQDRHTCDCRYPERAGELDGITGGNAGESTGPCTGSGAGTADTGPTGDGRYAKSTEKGKRKHRSTNAARHPKPTAGSMKDEDTVGPYIRQDYGYEGWSPQSFATLKEALRSRTPLFVCSDQGA